MCGITGLMGALSRDKFQSSVCEMSDALRHRGPDDDGVWVDHEQGIGLGHCRLSIVDLSAAGHQPMHSVSGKYVIAFNGEIYNHLELRSQLQADGDQCPQWRGHSDTETLLACFEEWGVKATLERLIGMFAIAVWNKQDDSLMLARDRMGEKPLYYGWCDGLFVFASELKAIRQYSGFSNDICREALCSYFRYSYIPAPYSIYKNIYKLEPGCFLTISAQATSKSKEFSPLAPANGEGWSIKQYWSLHEQAISGQNADHKDEKTYLQELESALKTSIQMQSIADVPLGAFLSGGIDSSLIVALMQSQANSPVKTFTIGFEESAYNEANYAKAVAAHLQTDHTELYLSADQTRDVIPQLSEIYDEPFADSSQIPTYLVAKMAREHVTVALSGDAGDELFGGYNRYFWGPKIWKKVSLLPYGLRQKFSHSLIALSQSKSSKQQLVNRVLPAKLRTALMGEKLQKLGQRLENVNNIDEFYGSLVSEWREPEEIVIGGKEQIDSLNSRLNCRDISSPEHKMMYKDSMSYLPDDILCKVDRAAMAVSLETRVPFLNHNVVELAWQLPLDMKIKSGQGKWALRQILYQYVPKNLIERPKQGFGIPLGDWLRGPLRQWAENLLDSSTLMQQGYLRPEPIQRKWKEHLSGEHNWAHSLWSVLMFQAWLETQQTHNSG